MLGGGAPIPSQAEREHAALLSWLAILGNPQALAKKLDELKRASEHATKHIAEATKAKGELEAKQRAHDEREQKVRVAEQNLERAIQAHQARHRELGDWADKIAADQTQATKDVNDAQEVAKQILADADAKVRASDETVKAALEQKRAIQVEVGLLTKQRDTVKAELRALANRLTGG